jgi:hypothetical protein
VTNAIAMGRPPTLEGKPCHFCRAEIVFARTPRRALMPLEVEPARAVDVPPLSRYTVDADEITTQQAPADAQWVYVPHFATCPETTTTAPTNAELSRRWTRNRR